MNFDGSRLYIRLAVEEETERALINLISSYSDATVEVSKERNDYGYQYERDRKVTGVEFMLQAPPPKTHPIACAGCAAPGICQQEQSCNFAPERA